MRYFYSLAIVLLLVGCDAVSTTFDDAGVFLRLQDETLTIRNDTAEPIYYLVMGQEFSHRADWIYTFREEVRIGVRQAKVLPLSDIPMDDNEERLVFFWWQKPETCTTDTPLGGECAADINGGELTIAL
ncbi:MAG: hypothetical protein AAGJ10_06560 [Bacteroidota bacterium]